MVVYGSVRVKANFCFISGGSEYVKMGLPGAIFHFSQLQQSFLVVSTWQCAGAKCCVKTQLPEGVA